MKEEIISVVINIHELKRKMLTSFADILNVLKELQNHSFNDLKLN